jgi:enoyl-CoA hydratase/carnithine racemase
VIEEKTYEHILFEGDGPVAYVTMNRPKKRNALSSPIFSKHSINSRMCARDKALRFLGRFMVT